jgi:HME family heavy-metal exporter
MEVDVLPNINKPTVTIFAEGEGLAAEEIERLVLTPVENALLGTPGVERVRGTASFGLALINAEFGFNSDTYRNRQLVQERLNSISLPERTHVTLGPVSSVLGEVMWLGVTGADVSSADLRTYADWSLRPSLLKTSGVSDVIIIGGDVLEWQVRLNAEAMRRTDITQEMVNELLRVNLKNASGGILTQDNIEYPVRILVTPETLEELRALTLTTNTGPVRLGEIASFVKGSSPVRGTGGIDGETGVVVRVFKQPNAETLTVTASIENLVTALQKSAPKGIEIKTDLFRQEWFITAGLSNVEEALRDAFIIVAIIVFLFLVKIRPTVITLLSIPASIAISAIVFYLLGLSVNVMTLGGIAVAIGELVDNAIVSVENIVKRLRSGQTTVTVPKWRIIVDAVEEIRGSVIYATALVLLVFVPVFFLGGVEGKLLSSLALAYIIALVASLVVSLTLTPALASLMLHKEVEEKPTRIALWLELWIDRTLVRLFGYSAHIGIALLVMIVLSGVLYVYAGKTGIPSFNEGSLTMDIQLPEGTDLETTALYFQRVSDSLKELPFIARTSQSVGRAAGDSHGGGANTGEMQIVLTEGSEDDVDEFLKQIQEKLNVFTGAQFSLGKPITHKVEQLLSGVRAPIVIKLYGDDIEAMRTYGEQIVGILKEIEGVANPQLSRDLKIPEIHVYPDKQVLSSAGTSAGAQGEETESLYLGNTVGEVIEGLQRIPVVTKIDNESRGSLGGLRDSVTADGSLGNTSLIYVSEGRNKVSHEGGKRVVLVSSNYDGTDIVGAVDTVKRRLDSLAHPQNVVVSYEGTYQSQKENSLRLALLFIGVIALIAFILYKAFPSWILVGLIMANIPTALFGGLIAVWMSGGSISLAHLVGFISLAGIVSRNGIILLSRALELSSGQNRYLSHEIIKEATRERIVPIMMTSIVTAIALVPFLLNATAPGKEFLNPLAIVITGGLITSTITSLLFLPVLLARYSSRIKI